MDDHGADLGADGEVEPDLCIVGAGPAGLTLAWALQGSGLRVLMLAGGGRRSTPRGQETYRGRQTGTPNEALTHARFRVLGGSATRWSALCRRLDAEDFAPKPGQPWTGWPIGPADLAPHYDAAERLLDVDGPGEAAGDWARRRLGASADGAGIDLDALRFARRHDLRDLCAPMIAAGEARIVLGADAVGLGRAVNGRRALRVRLASGRAATVRPRALVLACGAVETARLLLAARGTDAGIDDPHDLIGRCFMDHVYLYGPHVEDAAEGLAPFTVARFGAAADARGGYAVWRTPPGGAAGPCGAAAFLVPREGFQRHPDYEARGGRAARTVIEALRGERVPTRADAAALVDALRPSGLRSVLRQGAAWLLPDPRPTLRVQVEALPDPESRITLGDGRCPLGLPRAHLHWRTGAAERQAYADLQARIGAHLARNGLGRLAGAEDGEGWPPSQTGGKHHMGGARMADDPRRGVVGRDLEMHGAPGLYVLGSAVFATGGWANPTLTIVALALRLAAHLRPSLTGGG